MHEQFTLFDPPKRCTKCGDVKPLSEFYSHKRHKDGLAYHCKPCCRAAARDHHFENRDLRLAQMREWRNANPHKMQEYNRRSAINNAESRKRYYRLWYEANRERVVERTREYQQANPEKVGQLRRRYEARKRNAPGDGATLSELIVIHGYLCYLCQRRPATEVEHVTPLSRGGSNRPDNLRPACKSCNSRKGVKLMSELRWSHGA